MEVLQDPSFTRLEVLEGPTGRRSWSEEKKAEIVLESFAPGAIVRDVALRHGLRPQHLSTWRKLAKDGKLVMPGDADLPSFTPIVIDDAAGSTLASASGSGAIIEVQTGEVVLKTSSDIDPDRLALLASALRKAC